VIKNRSDPPLLSKNHFTKTYYRWPSFSLPSTAIGRSSRSVFVPGAKASRHTPCFWGSAGVCLMISLKSVRSSYLYPLFVEALLLAAFVSVDYRASADSAQDDAVSIVGLDAGLHSVERALPVQDLQKGMGQALSAVRDSILPALAAQAIQKTSAPRWRLRSIGVGVGLTGQLGLGSIWSISATPRIRLVFSNSQTPVYPD
jgi:hypothetical protein